MTLIFSADNIHANETVGAVAEKDDGRKSMKNGYYLVIIDSRHWHIALRILKKYGMNPCNSRELCMHLIPQRDEVSIKQLEAIIFSKIFK